MKKRIVALLLSALLIFAMLSGCGSDENHSAGSTSQVEEEAQSTFESKTETAEQPEEEASASAENSAAEEEVGTVTPGSIPVSLPISEEMIEIDWWTGDIGYLWSMLDDISENITLQELEARTNIHINWTFAARDTTEVTLMIASGDWADVVDNANNTYPGGISAGAADGVFLELTDAINDWMPNYKSYLDADSDLLRNSKDANGNIYFLSKIYKDTAPIMWGAFIRSDWAKELGYDPAEIDTYDEYYDVMMAMKSEYNMDSVFRLMASGVSIYGGLTYGYDVNGALWTGSNEYPLYAEEGTVKFATMEDGFKDYLKMMNQWYESGLISSDFVSNTDRDMFASECATGEFGVFYANISHVTNLYGQATEDGYELAPLAEPTINEGDSLHFSGSFYNRFSDNCMAILAETEYFEEICRFTDYLFSDEGATLMNYGIEGVSYDVVDGEIQLNKEWFDNCPNMPRAGNYNDVRTGMLGAGIYTCLLDYWGFYDNYYTDVQLQTQEVWASRTPETLEESWEMPVFIQNYMSLEDNSSVNTYLGDIGTYLEQMVPAFILGQKDIDAEWDAFVQNQKDMGIEDVIAIYQMAYDGYWS